ncbi:MAG: hypothetical protein IJO94_03900, partial [Firmicutes bacterium]|nr:hypothetical protein [Bacillota bacterium]
MLICCVLLYPLVYTPKPIYDMFPAENSSDEWIEKEAYVARGGTYPFLYSIQDAVTTPPDHYDKKTTEILLDSYADDPIPEDKKVNVIFVMYEAYADLSQELGDRLSRDPYRYYHQLQSESYHGELLTATYGGGTICTERSVIT